MIKMPLLFKAINKFDAIPTNIPVAFFTDIEQPILKSVWSHIRLQIAKATLSERSKARGITLTSFQLYYKAIVIKTVWYWHKNRHIDDQNRLEK